MDFDYALAQKLGLDNKESKLASAMDQLSVEELEGLLKEATPAAAPTSVKTVESPKLSAEMADQWGRELAQEEKTAGSRFGQTVGEIGKHIMKTDVGKRMAFGAAAGVAQDALMNDQSNAGSMATKALGGAMAGRYAKKGLKMLRTHDSDFGRGVAKGMKGWQNEGK